MSQHSRDVSTFWNYSPLYTVDPSVPANGTGTGALPQSRNNDYSLGYGNVASRDENSMYDGYQSHGDQQDVRLRPRATPDNQNLASFGVYDENSMNALSIFSHFGKCELYVEF